MTSLRSRDGSDIIVTIMDRTADKSVFYVLKFPKGSDIHIFFYNEDSCNGCTTS
jgi:hypothetical protein